MIRVILLFLLFVFIFIVLCYRIYAYLIRKNDKIHTFLEKEQFKRLASVYSHGGIHVFMLIIMGILILYFLYDNERLAKTVTHTIIVDVNDKMNDYGDFEYRNPGISINLYLNDNQIKKETNNEYKDAIDINILSHCMKEDSCISDISILRFPNNEPIKAVYEDTIISNNKEPEILKDSFEIYKIRARLIDKVQVPIIDKYLQGRNIRLYSNDFGVQEDEPYYYYNIKFKLPEYPDTLKNNQYSITIQLDSLNRDSDLGYYTKKQIWIKEISPKPDMITSGYISYYLAKTLETIREQGGIFLEAEDMENMNRNKRKEFQNSVLVGTCLAFALDIIIQLIIKLRNLNRDHERNNKDEKGMKLIENLLNKEDKEEKQSEAKALDDTQDDKSLV